MRRPVAFQEAAALPSLVLQPIESVGESKLLRAEALLRIHDASGQPMELSTFLRTVEIIQRTSEVDRWVLARVLEWLSGQAADPYVDRMHINVCGASLGDHAFRQTLLSEIKGSKLAHRICIEITETTKIEQPVSAARLIRSLQDLGAQIALDDFGAGFMSPVILRDFPVDMVKLDGRLIIGLDAHPRGQVVVRGLAKLFHDVHAVVVAECVETQAVLDVLPGLGIDYAQGYFVSRPLVPRDFESKFKVGSAAAIEA